MTILRHEPSRASALAAAAVSPLVQSAEERLTGARALIAAGKTEQALAILRVQLSDDGATLADLAAFLEVGGAHRPYDGKWASRVDHAIARIRGAGDLGEGDAVRTGRLLLMREEVAAAGMLAAWIERRYPESAATAPFLVEFYHRIGEPAAGLARLSAAAEAHPDDLDLAELLVSRLSALGRGGEATRLAATIAGQRPGPASAVALARAHLAAGGLVEAASAANWAVELGAAADDLEGLARGLAAAGAETDASGLIDRALAGATRHAGLHRLKAERLLGQGRKAEAAMALTRAVEAEPSAESIEPLVDVLLSLGRRDEAALIAQRLFDAEPKSVASRITRAKLGNSTGETAVAYVARQGTTQIRPHRVRLAGLIGPGGLGDFMYQLLALCSLGRQFSDASVTLLYKNDFSYKRDVLRFCPDLEEARDIGGDSVSFSSSDKGLSDLRHHMFFNHAALSPTLLSRLKRTATLVTPAEDVDGHTAALIARGLDPSRWFVAMHYRQNASFRGRGTGRFDLSSLRDVDPAPFHQLAASIVAQGGQVVRLGHPGMPPPPPMAGYIDLSEGGLPLQLFAVSKARFMVACDSGPTSYATAFKTPVFKTNAICEDGAVYAPDLILAKNVITWRGEVLSPRSMFEGRLMILKRIAQSEHGMRLIDNTFEQLRLGVDRMMARTPEGGWRAEAAAHPTPPPEAIAWPTEEASGVEVLDASHLSGRPVRDVDYSVLKRAKTAPPPEDPGPET